MSVSSFSETLVAAAQASLFSLSCPLPLAPMMEHGIRPCVFTHAHFRPFLPQVSYSAPVSSIRRGRWIVVEQGVRVH